MPQERTYGALSLAEIRDRIASRTMLSWATLDDMAAEMEGLRPAARAMLAALHAARIGLAQAADFKQFTDPLAKVRAAIAQAEAAGIKAEG